MGGRRFLLDICWQMVCPSAVKAKRNNPENIGKLKAA